MTTETTGASGQAAQAAQTGAARGVWGASRLYAVVTTIFGVIGLFMSGLIMYDKIKLMQDTDFTPACTLNDVVSCTDVMNSEQASAFVIPNPFIGLVGFSVVTCIGVALLAGARFRAWFWYGFLAGLIFAVGFVHWLAYEAIYNIEALCPYCMVVWAVVLPLFITTVVGIARARQRDRGEEVATGAAALFGMPLIVLVVWYLGFVALILQQFVF
ncbi:MAG TPA: vitamin K epoxide reductase family protein [Candidatus Corynebacterium avicola]|uniref:Vitamin K epoxide reductase family protein n=1 Tax=Candidatus Corynebacterium avicola TaxID=2838527 RepID=A0A9D1RMF7_9CORY|nr:vitamin K epoxide reductase family protein [Candidatus Corynebacterium avicola]